MEAALGGAFAKREDPGKSGISSVFPRASPDARGDASADPDSSWAQALGALEGEWAASLNLSRAPDSETKVTRSSPIQSQTQAASPSRYAGVASRDADDAFAAAEAAAAAAARAETPPPREDLVSREELVSRHDSSPFASSRSTRSIAAPLGVGGDPSVWRSFGEKPFADDWSDAATAGSRGDARRRGDFHDFQISATRSSSKGTNGTGPGPVASADAPYERSVGGLQVDGRSLAALANALDERSFDNASSFDDASSFGEPEASPASGNASFSGAAAGAQSVVEKENERSRISPPPRDASLAGSSRKKPSKEEEAKIAARRAEAAALRQKAKDADKKRRDAFAKKTRDAKNAAATTKKKAPASAGPGPAAKASARVVSSRRR